MGKTGALLIALVCASVLQAAAAALRTGNDALGDWSTDAPAVRRKITVNDLPLPNARESASNSPDVVRPPANAQLRVPPGFKIEQINVGKLRDPRFLLTAPNGNIFIAESRANQISVLRFENGAAHLELFAGAGLSKPFGLAFYPPGNDPQFLYVANTNGVIRFPYRNGDLRARRSGKIRSSAFRRRTVARRRALDARYCFRAGRQQNVRLGRLALERFGRRCGSGACANF